MNDILSDPKFWLSSSFPAYSNRKGAATGKFITIKEARNFKRALNKGERECANNFLVSTRKRSHSLHGRCIRHVLITQKWSNNRISAITLKAFSDKTFSTHLLFFFLFFFFFWIVIRIKNWIHFLGIETAKQLSLQSLLLLSQLRYSLKYCFPKIAHKMPPYSFR